MHASKRRELRPVPDDFRGYDWARAVELEREATLHLTRVSPSLRATVSDRLRELNRLRRQFAA
jgi:hypothetical protein